MGFYPTRVRDPSKRPKTPNHTYEHLVNRTAEQKTIDSKKGLESTRKLNPSPTRKKDLTGHRLQIIEETTERIKNALAEEHVTYVELARRMDMTPGHISHMMSGTRNMTLATLADIANAIGYEFTVIPTKKGTNGRNNQSAG